MRTLFVSIVTLALLAGSAIGIVAQSEAPADEVTRPQLEHGIAYGQDDPWKQVLHVFRLEPREAPRPAMILFHGGGLVMGTPLQDTEWARWLAQQGYMTFMAGYRLFD